MVHPSLLRTSGSTPFLGKDSRKKQENHIIINNVVDKIPMTEPQKVSALNHEALEFFESYYDENDLYQVENISLDKTKENIY